MWPEALWTPSFRVFLIITCSAIILINVYLCFSATLTSLFAIKFLLYYPCLCLHVYCFSFVIVFFAVTNTFPTSVMMENTCALVHTILSYLNRLCGILTLHSFTALHRWAQYNLMILCLTFCLTDYNLSVFTTWLCIDDNQAQTYFLPESGCTGQSQAWFLFLRAFSALPPL